jgi:hypothetical protein
MTVVVLYAQFLFFFKVLTQDKSNLIQLGIEKCQQTCKKRGRARNTKIHFNAIPTVRMEKERKK